MSPVKGTLEGNASIQSQVEAALVWDCSQAKQPTPAASHKVGLLTRNRRKIMLIPST